MEFFAPTFENSLTWENASAEYFWLDIGPFFDRIGPKRLQVMASADPAVKAVVDDAKMRKYIDIKRPDVAYGLDLIVTAGLITEADKQLLLNPVTTEYERHIKGLPQP